jgi:hypothetical protein
LRLARNLGIILGNEYTTFDRVMAIRNEYAHNLTSVSKRLLDVIASKFGPDTENRRKILGIEDHMLASGEEGTDPNAIARLLITLRVLSTISLSTWRFKPRPSLLSALLLDQPTDKPAEDETPRD